VQQAQEILAAYTVYLSPQKVVKLILLSHPLPSGS
jgi:hypothetical protein